MSNKIYRNKMTNIIYEHIGTTNVGYHILNDVSQTFPKPFYIEGERFKTGYEEYHEPEKVTKYINLYRHNRTGKITVGNAVGRGEADHRAVALKLYHHELIGRTKVEIVEGHFDD